MHYDEFKRRLGKAGLSVREFAELMHVSCNSISNYAAKDSVPGHIAISVTLMSEMADNGLNFRPALHALDIKGKKPRGAASAGTFGGSKQLKML